MTCCIFHGNLKKTKISETPQIISIKKENVEFVFSLASINK
jgi:hypothetical protein